MASMSEGSSRPCDAISDRLCGPVESTRTMYRPGARDDRQSVGLAQRREGVVEPLQLALLPPVRHIACHDDVVDPDLQQRAAQPVRPLVILGAATDVQVGQVRQLPRPPQQRKVQLSLIMARHSRTPVQQANVGPVAVEQL
jgi:hypothetical protein